MKTVITFNTSIKAPLSETSTISYTYTYTKHKLFEAHVGLNLGVYIQNDDSCSDIDTSGNIE